MQDDISASGGPKCSQGGYAFLSDRPFKGDPQRDAQKRVCSGGESMDFLPSIVLLASSHLFFHIIPTMDLVNNHSHLRDANWVSQKVNNLPRVTQESGWVHTGGAVSLPPKLSCGGHGRTSCLGGGCGLGRNEVNQVGPDYEEPCKPHKESSAWWVRQ